MGVASKRLGRFVGEHPWCCFCGGGVATETIDHIPARGLFKNREWPEGYRFPACENCNGGSADDELVLAAMFRLGLNKEPARTEHELQELSRAVASLREKRPEIAQELRTLSRVDTRKFFRAHGLGSPSADGVGELYAIRIPQSVFGICERYGQKLGKALHYLHAKAIVPQSGWVTARCFTNAEVAVSNWPNETLGLLGGKPALKRRARPLVDQFDYRFAVTDDSQASAYWVEFGGGAFVFVIAVHMDEQKYLRRRAEFENVATVELA